MESFKFELVLESRGFQNIQTLMMSCEEGKVSRRREGLGRDICIYVEARTCCEANTMTATTGTVCRGFTREGRKKVKKVVEREFRGVKMYNL